jgi:ribonuclease BN (tRNA processing enzyme)
VELCRAAEVKALAIFHLYPGHDDAYLRAIEAELQAAMPSAFVARERQAVSYEPVPAQDSVAGQGRTAKVPAE